MATLLPSIQKVEKPGDEARHVYGGGEIVQSWMFT